MSCSDGSTEGRYGTGPRHWSDGLSADVPKRLGADIRATSTTFLMPATASPSTEMQRSGPGLTEGVQRPDGSSPDGSPGLLQPSLWWVSAQDTSFGRMPLPGCPFFCMLLSLQAREMRSWRG